MTPAVQKLLWILLFAAIALTALWQFYPLPDAKARLDALPLHGPGFAGKDMPLSEFEKTFFHGVIVLKRLYQVDNRLFFVTVLDGTHNRHVVHDPYYCFRGSGWQILSERELDLPNGHAKILDISKGEQHNTAMFWFSDGIREFDSPFTFWWEATMRRLTLGRSGAEPVLIMIQPIENSTDVDWNRVLKTLHPLIGL